MTRRHPLLRLALVPVVAGAVVAASLTAAWIAIGRPTLASGAVWLQVVKTGEVHAQSSTPGQPFFFLIVGNDGSTERGRDLGLGDALHLVGVNPATNQATFLNIPRDTEGPNGGKINAYNSTEGLRAQANAVRSVVGVNVQYAITTNFDGFGALVDGMGGIDINVPTAMQDPDSGADFNAGPQHMNGDQALAFSRDRKSFATGDIQRTQNQGLLILATLATFRTKKPGAADTLKLVALLAQHVQLDGIGMADLFHLGRLALGIDPASIKNVTIPVANAGGTNLAPTADRAVAVRRLRGRRHPPESLRSALPLSALSSRAVGAEQRAFEVDLGRARPRAGPTMPASNGTSISTTTSAASPSH